MRDLIDGFRALLRFNATTAFLLRGLDAYSTFIQTRFNATTAFLLLEEPQDNSGDLV